MTGLASFAARATELLAARTVANKDAWGDLKRQVARELGVPPPSDAELAEALDPATRERLKPVWRTKPVRSRSGVAIVAVMSSPASCPHGKCSFCPGGPEVGVPQSYTGFEPSTMRAIEFAYDPYRIVRTRLAQLERNGHSVEKVDIVIQGGTFPARDVAYQEWFVAGITAGLNDGPGDGSWPTESVWANLDANERALRLAELQSQNETARCRLVGLTIETKPDWCLEPHIDLMLRLGATRVEIGIQTLDEGVLEATHRGHTLQESRRSLQVARDAGFKVCAHLMPGLPRPARLVTDFSDSADSNGSQSEKSAQSATKKGALDPDPAADIEDGRRLFAEPEWRPDMLKIYPTLVVQEGETLLKRQWQRGEFHPYDTAQAASVIARIKTHVPEWCRIQRVDRDIPTTHVEAGVLNSNLRQFTHAEMARLGLPPCRCVRCRESGSREAVGMEVDAERAVLVRRTYEAAGGTELFLSFEDPDSDAILGFLRLRRVGVLAHRPETRVPGGAAFVRELKVFGTARALADDPEGDTSLPAAGSFQHQGFGSRLLAEAETVAHEWGVGRLLVIAGPGVKPYYRARGYSDCGPYVAKVPNGHA
ncbi:MAG: radical SAM protein [Candidatus Thermoplasmatota archaeon]